MTIYEVFDSYLCLRSESKSSSYALILGNSLAYDMANYLAYYSTSLSVMLKSTYFGANSRGEIRLGLRPMTTTNGGIFAIQLLNLRV